MEQRVLVTVKDAICFVKKLGEILTPQKVSPVDREELGIAGCDQERFGDRSGDPADDPPPGSQDA
jgi:hypothetical protein